MKAAMMKSSALLEKVLKVIRRAARSRFLNNQAEETFIILIFIIN